MTLNQQSLKKFQNRVRKFAKNLPAEKVALFQRRLALEGLARLIDKTPVDTGRARGAWIVTVGQPSMFKPGPGVVISAEQAQSRGAKALGPLSSFDIVYITNNVEYIEKLERGTSTQAPHGMLSSTVAELSALFIA